MNLINWLTSPIAEALGWTLIHAVWQGFVVVLTVALLLYLTRGSQASLRYWVGISGLLIQALISGITFGWYFEPGQTVGLPVAGGSSSLMGFAIPSSQSWPTMVQAFLNGHLPEVVWAWLVGVGLFGVRLVGGWAFVQRLRVTAILPVPVVLVEATERIAGQLKVAAQIQVTARVTGPVVVGILKPVVLWPAGLLAGLSAADIEAVLAHELAHIRRHDYFFNLLQSFIEVIYFFHPALWWLSARVREEREHCCDDVAVQLIGNAHVLARALARVEEWQHEAEAVPTLAVAFASKRQLLLQRVRRILGVPTRPFVNNTSLVGLTMITFLLLGLSVYAVGRVETEQQKMDSRKQIAQVIQQQRGDGYSLKEATANSWSVPLTKRGLSQSGLPKMKSDQITEETVRSADMLGPTTEYGLVSSQDTARLRAAQQQLEALAKQMQAIISERQPVIDRLSKEMSELTFKNTDWQKQTEPLAKKMGDLSRKQAELARKMAPLQTKISRLSQQNTAKANQLIRQNEQQRELLEKQMEQLSRQMEKLEKQMEPLNQRLEPDHQRLGILADSISKLVEPTYTLSEKIGELSRQIAEDANEQAEQAVKMAEDVWRKREKEEELPARAPRAAAPGLPAPPAHPPRARHPAVPATPGHPALPAPPDAVTLPRPGEPVPAPRALSPKAPATPKEPRTPKPAVAPRAQ